MFMLATCMHTCYLFYFHTTSFMNMGTQIKFKFELAKRLGDNLTFFQLWPVYLEIHLSSGTFMNTEYTQQENFKYCSTFSLCSGTFFNSICPHLSLLKWFDWSSNTTTNQIFIWSGNTCCYCNEISENDYNSTNG